MNDSGEHVIPNALGGRCRVRGFICDPCNKRTGSDWEGPLTKALERFSVLVGVPRRHRGSVQSAQFDIARYSPADEDSTSGQMPVAFREENLEKVTMKPDGRMTIPKPTTPHHVKENSTHRIKQTLPSIDEANDQVKKWREKYPNSEIIVTEKATYGSYWIDITPPEIDEPAQGRAITKMALALAVEAGVRSTDYEKAEEYFKEDDKPCWSFFYDFDPIKNRVEGTPLHVVHVQGDPTSGRLIGYVELFGCLRFGVCLATAYEGEPINRSYAINPMTGEEEDVEVEFCCTPDQVQAMCDGAVPPLVEYHKAAAALKIVPTIQSLLKERELRRAKP